MKKKYYNEESGRSMIEMLGVLSVMGMITAAAFVLLNSGRASQRLARLNDDVANIAVNVRGVFAESPDYKKLPGDDDWKKGVEFLDALYMPTVTPFGGGTMYSVAHWAKDPSYFFVIVAGLSEDDCDALANRSWEDAEQAHCDDGVLFIMYK
mgnify:CR=1 FL=1